MGEGGGHDRSGGQRSSWVLETISFLACVAFPTCSLYSSLFKPYIHFLRLVNYITYLATLKIGLKEKSAMIYAQHPGRRKA